MDKLLSELKQAYGQTAEFRAGQREAIQYVLDGQRLLVVQKTGWGKSLVYFLAAKMIRSRGSGITLIISPLLALMNNQIDSAKKLGICVETINSENTDDWKMIQEKLVQGEIDALIISPERLSNADFKRFMIEELASQIALFVVDEAHCISDWGHDFRPDYRRIVDIINILPSNIAVLATTATASDRVTNDIKKQLGDNLLICRGSLMRESLYLQVIKLYSKEARMAWILSNMEIIPGTGIIYCLTVNDCKLVNNWLNKNGVASASYYSDMETEQKTQVVNSFMKNEIKVLVATVAFGMGFDKPDISFVIHFQRPGNIIAYYQQIGRAGRAIDKSYAILLCGGEDDEINRYFINSAFPTEDLMEDIIKTVIENPGIQLTQFERLLNMKPSKIKACIKYLMVNGDIYKDDKKYYKTARSWKPDIEKSRQITNIRNKELREMEEYSNLDKCYMEFIAHVLDDPDAKKCEKCVNCTGIPLLSNEVPESLVLQAQQFIREDFNVINPRKRWPSGEKVDGGSSIASEFQCETGRVLSNYGDAGWGRMVSQGKYMDSYFSDQLVEASASLLVPFIEENHITWVTSVPSVRRPELVRSFAVRLAERLGLQYHDVVRKIEFNVCQKELNTSYLQYKNAYSSFEASQAASDNLLLVDDMVDSRWTLTVCGYKLRKCGSGKVFPFALANSAGRNGDE